MKIYEAVTLITGGVLALWIGYGVIFESSVETPPFESLPEISGFEVRRYPDLSLVSHSKDTKNGSFGHLFRYIDGNNEKNQKISMTAPVIEANGEMMFVLPSTLTNVPKPAMKSLKLKKITGLTVVVSSFRGSAGKASEVRQKMIEKLKKQMNRSPVNGFIPIQLSMGISIASKKRGLD